MYLRLRLFFFVVVLGSVVVVVFVIVFIAGGLGGGGAIAFVRRKGAEHGRLCEHVSVLRLFPELCALLALHDCGEHDVLGQLLQLGVAALLRSGCPERVGSLFIWVLGI